MSHVLIISRPIALFLAFIGATDVYSSIEEIQSSEYTLEKSIADKELLFTTRGQSYLIYVYGCLFGESEESLQYSGIVAKLGEWTDEVTDYYELSLRSTENVEVLRFVIGCSKEWKSLPTINTRIGDYPSNPLGVRHGCRIYTLNGEDYVMKVVRIDESMPDTVWLHLEMGDMKLALRLNLVVQMLGAKHDVKSCTAIEPPDFVFKSFTVINFVRENVVDQPVVAVGGSNEGELNFVDLSVMYKDKLMLSIAVKCGLLTAPLLNENEWTYSFLSEGRMCFAVSEIPHEQKSIIDIFAIDVVKQRGLRIPPRGLRIAFGLTDSDNRDQRFEMSIKLLLDGCSAIDHPAPVEQPAAVALVMEHPTEEESLDTVGTDEDSVDEMENDLCKYPLTKLEFGEIATSALTSISSKNSLGLPAFPLFPGAARPQFSIPSLISGSLKEVIERVVVHFAKSPNAELPPNSMLLVLSVLYDKSSGIQDANRKYYGRLGVLITCSETADIGVVENTMPFGKNCVVNPDFIQSKNLKLSDQCKTAHDDFAEFDVTGDQGIKFSWRISNSPIAYPDPVNPEEPIEPEIYNDRGDSGKEQKQSVVLKEMAETLESNSPKASLILQTGGKTIAQQQSLVHSPNEPWKQISTERITIVATDKSRGVTPKPTHTSRKLGVRHNAASLDQTSPAMAAVASTPQSSSPVGLLSVTPKKNSASIINSSRFLVVVIVVSTATLM